VPNRTKKRAVSFQPSDVSRTVGVYGVEFPSAIKLCRRRFNAEYLYFIHG